MTIKLLAARAIVILSFIVSTHCGIKAQWVHLPFPQVASSASPNCVGGRYLIVAFQGLADGLFRTSDHGDTWQPITMSLGKYFQVTALVYSDSCLFASVFDPYQEGKQGIYRSTDLGDTWQQSNGIQAGVTLDGNATSFLSYNNYLFACGERSLVRSSDKGINWEAVGKGLPSATPSATPWYLRLMAHGDRLYMLIQDGGVFRSLDSGLSWHDIGPGRLAFLDFASLGNKLFVVDNGMLESEDTPTVWSQVRVIDWSNFTRSIAVYGNTILAAGDNVYCSVDSGVTWLDQSENLQTRNFCSLGLQDDFVFVFTDNGVWRRSLLDLRNGIQLDAQLSPSSRTYPNPLSKYTTIAFTLPKRTDISLDIYDALGKNVYSLYSSGMEAGPHSITWNASQQPSGIYYYHLSGFGISSVGEVAVER